MGEVDRALLDTAVASEPLAGHDGRSGASLTRVRLADGTSVVVKRCDPATDLSMRLTGDTRGRELWLWASGVLDALPSGVGHPVVGAWREGDEVVTVMRDLGGTVLAWDQPVDRASCHRILRAADGVHDTFRGHPPAGLCTLPTRLRLFAPAVLESVQASDHPIVVAALTGWDRFAGLVPADVRQAAAELHDDPSSLVSALQESAPTLVHADLWPVNVALTPEQVVLLDWALATEAPAAFEFSTFLMGAAQATIGLDQLVDEVRLVQGPWFEARTMRLALLASLLDLGWNLALDATGRDDRVRERASAELAWWVEQARAAIDVLT